MSLLAAYMYQSPSALTARRREFVSAIAEAGLDAKFSTPLGQDILAAYSQGQITLDGALARMRAVELAR